MAGVAINSASAPAAATVDSSDCGVVLLHNLAVGGGRGLAAQRAFQPSDVLFSEWPLVCAQFAWNRRLGYRACEQCLRPLETTQANLQRLCQQPHCQLPSDAPPSWCPTVAAGVRPVQCTGCQSSSYCSESCRETAAATHHAVLCPAANPEKAPALMQLEELWRSMHHPPESATIELPLRLVAMVTQAARRPHGEADLAQLLQQIGGFCAGAVDGESRLVHKLLGPGFAAQVEQLRLCFSQHFFEPHLKHLFSQEGFSSLLALVGRNSQGIATSPWSLWVRRSEEAAGAAASPLAYFVEQVYEQLDEAVGLQFVDAEGAGLYCRQSLLNHSCTPNAEVRFAGDSAQLSVVALTEISAGEEVFISYLDECQLARSRHSRAKQLRDNYLFECVCARCQSEARSQPDLTSDEEDEDEDEDEDDEAMQS